MILIILTLDMRIAFIHLLNSLPDFRPNFTRLRQNYGQAKCAPSQYVRLRSITLM
jgi:hypothetical protein